MLARMEDWNNAALGKNKILQAIMNEIATTCFNRSSNDKLVVSIES